MDANTASVIIEAIKIVVPVVTAGLGVWTVMQSRKNGAIIKEVQHQNNSLLEARIASEREVSAAREVIARHEGGDAARIIGEKRAVELLGAAPAEVNVVEAVPIEIKGKLP